jgi:hypothetical protein
MDYLILDEEDTDTKNAQIMLKEEKKEECVFQSWTLFSLELETPSWRTRKKYLYGISYFFIGNLLNSSVHVGSGGLDQAPGSKTSRMHVHNTFGKLSVSVVDPDQYPDPDWI